jgi:hypothetical protein
VPSFSSDLLGALGISATPIILLVVALIRWLPRAVLMLLAGVVAILGREEQRRRRAHAVLRLVLAPANSKSSGPRRSQ